MGGHVAWIREIRKAQTILAGKSERKSNVLKAPARRLEPVTFLLHFLLLHFWERNAMFTTRSKKAARCYLQLT